MCASRTRTPTEGRGCCAAATPSPTGPTASGAWTAGLFFLAYQRDVRDAFIPVQRNLARNDALNEYIQHVGSAVFAIPPGVLDEDDWWGRGLFSS